MEINNTCTGRKDKVGHDEIEYLESGFCPCGEYISHVSNKVCDVSTSEITDKPSDCHCRSERCPCGDMTSHRVSEPCNAVE